jgi:hypothetical protein
VYVAGTPITSVIEAELDMAVTWKYDVNGSLLWTHEFRLSDHTLPAYVSATADSVYLMGGKQTSPIEQYARKYDSAQRVVDASSRP